ncbi:bifunctional diguanylate cyclase/phosphodiesterase [Alicyclobacillus sp. SO9]|uniref:putative bifunctional diguanylate cyclase/phosphodiesterase n=1 Tax=Alicyclobacillus sp. SO9 TaxID=2665646 RepID=UPI0018E7A180|nr:EAL domain-containing protein [Alicyclobacillus sp. SO9]QQE79319.1 EAL domain-containing protein [Alicyclobacillus sp. SO9]
MNLSLFPKYSSKIEMLGYPLFTLLIIVLLPIYNVMLKIYSPAAVLPLNIEVITEIFGVVIFASRIMVRTVQRHYRLAFYVLVSMLSSCEIYGAWLNHFTAIQVLSCLMGLAVTILVFDDANALRVFTITYLLGFVAALSTRVSLTHVLFLGTVFTTMSLVSYAASTLRLSSLRRSENAQLKLKQLAFYDELTGVANRTLFIDKLSLALAGLNRESESLAVLFLDLDQFKSINDSLGHHVGDEVLKLITGRIQSCISEAHILARMGGDEFMLLIPEQTHSDEAIDTAVAVMKTVEQPMRVGEHTFYLTLSIGIAYAPHHGLTAEELMKNADSAMYSAKRNGRQSYRIYTNDMNSSFNHHLQLAADLRAAPANGEFFLEYHPRIDAYTGNVASVEALVRWNHPKFGILYPDTFIPVAKENKITRIIGEWVLDQICRQILLWKHDGSDTLRVAMNVAAADFQQPEFVQEVQTILHRYPEMNANLEIEITEAALADNSKIVAENITALRSLGIVITIDDFGTGYSSLGLLKDLDVSCLKIDNTFINDITDNDKDLAVAKSIIAIAEARQLAVIAEGVETEQQLDLLRELGCHEIQGHFFCQSLSPADLQAFMETRIVV